MPNASPFLLHSGPGTFALHGPQDSCHPVKIPGLLSECSLFLCCSKNWKEEEGSFSGNPTTSVMGLRQERGQEMVLVGVSGVLGHVGGLLTAVSQINWIQMKQNGRKNYSSYCLLYAKIYLN